MPKKAEPNPEWAEHPTVQGVRWILANRKQPDGKRMNQSALARLAGLNRSHIQQIVGLYINPSNLGAGTLRAIARAGNVRTDWLATGRPPREPYEGEGDSKLPLWPPEEERYEEREVVIPLLRAQGFTDEEIESLRTVRLKEGERFTERDWIDKAREIRRLNRELAQQLRDDSDVFDVGPEDA